MPRHECRARGVSAAAPGSQAVEPVERRRQIADRLRRAPRTEAHRGSQRMRLQRRFGIGAGGIEHADRRLELGRGRRIALARVRRQAARQIDTAHRHIGMTGAEPGAPDVARAAIRGFRLGISAAMLQQSPEILEALRHQGMVATQRALGARQRLAE